MGNERAAHPRSNGHTMSLEGAEATELYALELLRKLTGLRVQVGLLHAEIAKSKLLLDDVNSGAATGLPTGQTGTETSE